MNATNKPDAIAEFLEKCGSQKSQLEIKWTHRETFFEDDVQDVLMERHPSRFNYSTELNFSYPILAWRTADQQSLVTNEFDDTELTAMQISKEDREWFARLTIAVLSARKRLHERASKPQTVFEKFLVWRHGHFMEETSRLNPIDPPEKYSQALAFIFGKQKIDTEQATASIRQAVFKENNRRNEIMERWAECWLVHIRGTYVPKNSADIRAAQMSASVTKTTPNK